MSAMTTVVVDTVSAVHELVAIINALGPSQKPQLYIDIEGVNLCRQGCISIIQVFLPSRSVVCL